MDPTVVETIRINVDDGEASRAYDGLEQSQRDLAKAVRALDGTIDRTMGNMGRESKAATKQVKQLNATILNLDAALGLAEKSVAALRRGFEALQRPIDLATGFEAGVAQIQTLGQDLAADFEDQLLGLAREVPQTAGDLTRATYDAISAGIAPTGVIDFIRATSDAAVAGGAGLTESVGVLTTAVNAFTELNGDAARAADILFATVRAGVTDFRQLAATDVGASLAQTGVRLDEVGALLAELTKRGQTTSSALTIIQSLAKSIQKPTTKAARAFKSLGVEVGASALQSKGLTGILAELDAAAGGNLDIISQLSDRTEALTGFQFLLTGGMEQYSATLETVRTSQGATAESAAIMARTAQGAQARFRSLTEGVLTQLGREVLPVVNELLEDLGKWLAANGDELVSTIKGAVEQLVALGRWAADNGREIVTVLGSIFVAKKVTEWTSAVSKAVDALGGMTGASEAVAKGIFQPKTLGGAFAAALRSPAFIGLISGAVIGLGAYIAQTINAEFQRRIATAQAAGAARVDAPTRELAPLDREALQAVSEQNLRRIFGERGAEGLAEFVEKQKAVIKERIGIATKEFQDLGVQVRRRSKAFRATMVGLAERVDGVTKDMTAEQILALPDDVKRDILTRTGANRLFGDGEGSFLEDAAELVRLQKEASDPSGAYQQLTDALNRVPAAVQAATAPAPSAPTGPSLPVSTAAAEAAPDTFFADVEAQARIRSGLRQRAEVIAGQDAITLSGLFETITDGVTIARVAVSDAMFDMGVAMRDTTAAAAEQQRQFIATTQEAAAYSSSVGAALGAATALGDAFGLSAKILAPIKIAENAAFATEEGAKALAAGAIGNIPGAIAHSAAAAQHVAAGIKWGVDALGGGGRPSVPSVSGAGAVGRPSPSALPPPPQSQPSVVNVTIDGVVATNRGAARELGGMLAAGVTERMRQAAGRRGSFAAVPASAGARF